MTGKYTCVICHKHMRRWDAMRAGGVAEELLGRCFICRSCVADGVTTEKLLEAVKEEKHEARF